MRIRPLHLGFLLLGLSVLVLGLNVLGTPRPPPHSLDVLTTLRILLGLPVLMLVPGFFLAPVLLGKNLRSRHGEEGQLDLSWTLVGALGLNIVCHFLMLQLLAAVAGGATPISLSILLTLSCIAGLGLFMLEGTRDLSFAPPSASLLRGLGYGAVVLVAIMAMMAPKLVRDSSWYFYNPLIDASWEATDDRGAIDITWADGTPFVDGKEFVRSGRIMRFQIENNADTVQRVPMLLLVHGHVGTDAWLQRVTPPEATGPVYRIATTEAIDAEGPKVERYYRWGTAALTVLDCHDNPDEPPYNPNEVCEGIAVPAGGVVVMELHIRPMEAIWGVDPEHTWVTGWGKLSTGEIQDELGSSGHQHMHPYQLLNVTENIRWAEEVALGSFVLPGRPARKDQTVQEAALAQPPAWSYVYATARRLLTDQTAGASALLVAMLLVLLVVGLKAIEHEIGEAPHPALGISLGFAAAQWGQLMVRDGSVNFPDNLYALALTISVVALVSGRTRVFVIWAILATLLRYPGAAVVGMAGASLFLLAPKKRQQTVDGLARYGLVLAVFCGLMLIAGIRSGQLDPWFYSLYWETIPEHFRNNAYAPPMGIRPVLFVLKWVCVGGGVLLLAFPFRGLLSRTTLATAMAYMPFLAFIDHHSNHYFLPLIALAGISACASIAQAPEKRRNLLVLVLAVFSFLLFVTSHTGRHAVEALSDQAAIQHETIPEGPDEEAETPPEDAPE